MIEAKFKFGQKVKITHDFFGVAEGIIMSVSGIKEGTWPFRKTKLYYQVEVLRDDPMTGEPTCYTVVIDENFVEPTPEFKPKIIK